jgi:hypothetical protein
MTSTPNLVNSRLTLPSIVFPKRPFSVFSTCIRLDVRPIVCMNTMKGQSLEMDIFSKDLEIVCFIKISLSCDYPFQIMYFRVWWRAWIFIAGKARCRSMCGEKCNLCRFYLLNIYLKSWSKNRIDLLIANQHISQMYSVLYPWSQN